MMANKDFFQKLQSKDMLLFNPYYGIEAVRNNTHYAISNSY